MTYGDPIRTGGLGDPVAENIRAEQQRDAMPTPEEARQKHRDHLASEGCAVCGETDPDALRVVQWMPHECSRHQQPPEPKREVFCEEHARAPREFRRARRVKRARHRDAPAVVLYTCEFAHYAERPEPETYTETVQQGWDEDGDPIWKEVEREMPHKGRPRPEAPLRCDCGAAVADIIYLNGVE